MAEESRNLIKQKLAAGELVLCLNLCLAQRRHRDGGDGGWL
jgi:hypothetical protein